MYMNLKPNQHKRMFFNTTTMTSLGFMRGCLKFLAPPLKFRGGGGGGGGGGLLYVSATLQHFYFDQQSEKIL